MCNLCIQSDFIDYYDYLSSDTSNIIYNRYVSQCKQRGVALKYLRNLGIKTVELKQVNKFFREDGNIVVYTDPRAHNSLGKKIMTVDEANQMYANYIASHYYETTEGITLKFLQVGKRRFTLYYKKNDHYSLEMGKLIDIRESKPYYNRLIGLPIFSIDYISNGREMIATDFNEVENLKAIGVSNLLKSQDVILEIVDALIAYNKI